MYKTIGAEPALLAAVLDVAVGADDAPVGVVVRDSIARLRTLRSAGEVVEGYVHVMAQVHLRVAQLLLLAAQSADGGRRPRRPGRRRPPRADDGTRATPAPARWPAGRRDRGHHPRDVLWTYTSAQLYDLLVGRRGWSLEQYERFVREALVAALLTSSAPGRVIRRCEERPMTSA